MDTDIGKALCGVYLLRGEQGEVLYVGQSVNCLARVGQHAADLAKVFSGVTVLECAPDDLEDLEGLLIQAIAPPLNTSMGRHPKVVRTTQHWGRVPKRIREMTPVRYERTVGDYMDDDLSSLIEHVRSLAKVGSDGEGYANSNEVSRLMGGISVGSLKQMSVSQGFPTPRKLGSRLVWLRREVLNWIDAHHNKET